MGTGIYIALLNPAISAIFAAGFFYLWRHQRERGYIAILALSYVAAACGFVLQSTDLPFGAPVSKLLSNTFFVATAYLMAVGILGKFGRRPPHAVFGIIGAVGLGTLSWYLFVEPDITRRVLAINLTLAGMCLTIAAGLRSVPGKIFVDRLLMVALAINGLNFLVRPLVIIIFTGPPAGDGDIFITLYWITTAVTHAFNSVLLAICLMTGIALEVIAQLRRDALNDQLSGVLNRRGFEERAEKVLRQAECVSLVLADLDRFKSINDGFGHAGGDRVIAAFGTMLRDLSGEDAVVGRIGGEEFAVLLPGRGTDAALALAESVRHSFGAVAIAGLPKGASFTASFGVAGHEEGDTLSTLLARADTALYQAKDNGRNQVRLYSGAVAPDRRRRATG